MDLAGTPEEGAVSPHPTLPAELNRVEELVALHEAPLLARARKLCRNDHEARDLVQDTFERALRHIASLRQGAHARGWLLTILTNLFLDRLKHADVIQIVELTPAHHPVAPLAPPGLQVTSEHVLAAIAALEHDLRQVIELHEFQGLGYREVAARLGVPVGTVGSRLTRARDQLRVLLEPLTGGEL